MEDHSPEEGIDFRDGKELGLMRRAGRIQSAERAKPTSITAGIQITNLLSACDADTGDPLKGDFHEEAASVSPESRTAQKSS